MNPDIYRNDDLDTRREMLILLQHLSPAQRLAFLNWAVNRAGRNTMGDATHDQGIVQHKVRPGTNGENLEEIYWDVSLLFVAAGLQVDQAMRELARRVRNRDC